MSIAETDVQEARPVEWEYVLCNLCKRDKTEVYHRERLGYFDAELDFQIVQCRHCGLVYTNPRIAEHNATYLQENLESVQVLSEHDRAKAKVFHQALDEIEWLQKQPGQRKPGRLLDVGCGSGQFLMEARQRDYDVCGIEPARKYAEYARREHDVNVLQCNVSKAEIEAESCDVITLWDVIEHVADPCAVMQQRAGWLKPGGIMALRFPSASWQKIKGVIYQKLLFNQQVSFGGSMHLYFFSPNTISQLAQEASLEVTKIKTTPAEMNAQSKLKNSLKATSQFIVRTCETISGRHLGNLEVYCRKR